jgi:hypothetical protein
MDFEEVVGFGIRPKPEFWIGPRQTGEAFRESYIAFSAPSWARDRRATTDARRSSVLACGVPASVSAGG